MEKVHVPFTGVHAPASASYTDVSRSVSENTTGVDAPGASMTCNAPIPLMSGDYQGMYDQWCSRTKQLHTLSHSKYKQ